MDCRRARSRRALQARAERNQSATETPRHRPPRPNRSSVLHSGLPSLLCHWPGNEGQRQLGSRAGRWRRRHRRGRRDPRAVVSLSVVRRPHDRLPSPAEAGFAKTGHRDPKARRSTPRAATEQAQPPMTITPSRRAENADRPIASSHLLPCHFLQMDCRFRTHRFRDRVRQERSVLVEPSRARFQGRAAGPGNGRSLPLGADPHINRLRLEPSESSRLATGERYGLRGRAFRCLLRRGGRAS